ncbi:MAG TPA: hypothetical protein VNT53_01225 [Pseudolysinimonas sp.]|nr:hypothetical protein [Pseudolysinimonas sp.]
MADASPRQPWLEPSLRVPLHWGFARSRSWGGLTLIIAGAVAMVGSTYYSQPIFVGGIVMHLLGWCVMPAAGWRRAVALVPSLVAVAALLGGPQFMFLLVLPAAAWLLVRHRPGRSYATLIVAAAGTFAVSRAFSAFADMPLALAIGLAAVVASAWLARALDALIPTR